MDISKLRKNKHYALVLSKIQKTIPEAIIAGGAIRDLCHGKTVKDVDIYVPCETTSTKDSLCAFEEDFWGEIFSFNNPDDYIEQAGDSDESYEGKNHIGIVWEIQSEGVLYNIILVDINPIEYVEKYFDIGLCKAYFDGKRFRLTADFINDSKNKTLTVVVNNIKQGEFEHMMEWHVAKLQRKYKDHTVVVPEKYTEMYNKFIKNKVL